MANDQMIKDATAPTDQEKDMAILAMPEEYITALMLISANCEQFNKLRNELQNQYGYGEDRYPKTTDACLSLLNCWKVSTTPQPRTLCTATPAKPKEDAALIFAQDAIKSGGPQCTSLSKNIPSDDSSNRSTKDSPANLLSRTLPMFGARPVGALAMSLLSARSVSLLHKFMP